VKYSSDTLSKRFHFAHIGGTDPNVVFSLRKTTPVFIRKSQEQQAKLSRASLLTLRELIIDGQFESDARTLLRKPDFLFWDSIDEDEGRISV